MSLMSNVKKNHDFEKMVDYNYNICSKSLIVYGTVFCCWCTDQYTTKLLVRYEQDGIAEMLLIIVKIHVLKSIKHIKGDIFSP